jgi:glutathione S-transferase
VWWQRSNVPYPALYAEGTSEKAFKFNSIQRGHQNMLEALPIFLICQLLISTVYPYTAASIILFWTLGRVVYFLGYSKSGPSGRTPGAIWTIGTQLITWLSLTFIGVKAFLTG